MALAFMAGVTACSLLLFAMSFVIPLHADIASDPSVTSDNTTNGLLSLLPDISKIYNSALTMPFIKAESQIHDKDIADYYRALMDETGLAPSQPQPQTSTPTP